MPYNVNVALSLESISHQSDYRLRDAIIAEIEKLADSKKPNFGKLEQVIKDLTGLNINIELDDYYVNAFVICPSLDKNHPLMAHFRRGWLDNKDASKLIKRNHEVIKGTVSALESKVTGVYTDIEVTIGLGAGIFDGKFLTAAEGAAVLLHELGHLFDYYYYLGATVTSSYAMQAVLADGRFGVDKEYTKDIIIDAEGMLNVTFKDKDTMIKNGKEGFVTAIASECVMKTKSELDNESYDVRGFETLADQFAARHGSSMDLVTGLGKIHKRYGNPAYLSSPLFYSLDIASVLLMTVGSIVLPPLAIIILLSLVPEDKIYDDPKERFRRIRDQVVSALKADGIDKNSRRHLLKQLEKIDLTMAQVHERSGLLERLSNMLFRSKSKSNENLQRDIEALLNNELFVASAKLKDLTV